MPMSTGDISIDLAGRLRDSGELKVTGESPFYFERLFFKTGRGSS